jgi:hypothetical protein
LEQDPGYDIDDQYDQTDPDLAFLNAAWPRLPDAIKAGILAIAQAAGASNE